MQTADRFLKFAAESEVMAKCAPTGQQKAVWRGLAWRWRRCATLAEQQEPDAVSHRDRKG